MLQLCFLSGTCQMYAIHIHSTCTSENEIYQLTPWINIFSHDMNACSIGGIDPQNRTAWRSGIRSISCLLPTPATGKTRSSWKIKSGSSQVKSGSLANSIDYRSTHELDPNSYCKLGRNSSFCWCFHNINIALEHVSKLFFLNFFGYRAFVNDLWDTFKGP